MYRVRVNTDWLPVAVVMSSESGFHVLKCGSIIRARFTIGIIA